MDGDYWLDRRRSEALRLLLRLLDERLPHPLVKGGR